MPCISNNNSTPLRDRQFAPTAPAEAVGALLSRHALWQSCLAVHRIASTTSPPQCSGPLLRLLQPIGRTISAVLEWLGEFHDATAAEIAEKRSALAGMADDLVLHQLFAQVPALAKALNDFR